MQDQWGHVEEIELVNDGSGLGFGIVGGKTTGVVVRTLVPHSVADKVSLSVLREMNKVSYKYNNVVFSAIHPAKSFTTCKSWAIWLQLMFLMTANGDVFKQTAEQMKDSHTGLNNVETAGRL